MKSFLLGAVAVYGANPIRRVVTLLQDMKKEVEVEGEKEAALYKKFQCYCKGNDGELNEDAKKAQVAIETNNAAATEKTGLKKRTVQELKQHKIDREEATAALAQATALRKKEAAAYAAAAGDHKEYIDATNSAIAALKKGKSGAFLQTRTAGVLKNLVSSKVLDRMDAADRMTMSEFLQQSKDYIPQSGEIIGILQNMLDEFSATLGGIDQTEATAAATYQELKAAKKQEIAAATSSIESKTELKGKLAVQVAQHVAAAESATKELSDSQEFLVKLKSMCANKASDWESRSKKRVAEVASIDEAIKVLNDDDALDIFKKSLSLSQQKKHSFLQMGARKSPSLKVQQILKSAQKSKNPALALMAHTVVAKLKQGVDFSKIIVMIDEMVALLKQESKEDETTRDMCEKDLRDSGIEAKNMQSKIASLESQISEMESAIAAHKETVETKNAEIKALDKSVSDATAQRKEENEDFDEMMGLNTSAVQLIQKAINKLNKYYNPHMYKAPEERELTEEEKILRGAGQDIGDVSKTAAIDGTTQTTTLVFSQAPPPPPETYGAYKKKGAKSNSVVALLNMLIKELQDEMQTAQHEEKTAQRDYEALVKDAAASRATAVKVIAETESAIAEEEDNMQTSSTEKLANEISLGEVQSQITQLHAQCDFIIAHFEERLAARETEIEGLVNAKGVLSGASFQ